MLSFANESRSKREEKRNKGRKKKRAREEEMNQNHTVTMNSQQMQRRPYINSRGGVRGSNNMNNHRMQRISFGQNQQSHHNHRGNNVGGVNGNQNKDLDCFNGNNSHSG